jgi:hypothetical protein
MDVKSIWIPTWRQMDHVSWSLGLFQKPLLRGRPNTKFLEITLKGPVAYDFTSHLRVCDQMT